MDARATLLGHPIHQMVIVLPLGLLLGSVVFDLTYLAFGVPGLLQAAYWTLALGIASGVFAAVFGVIDWTKIPSNSRAKRIGMIHAGVNAFALALFAASFALRTWGAETPTLRAHWPAWFAAIFMLVGGWLGGELVNRLGIGVHEGAHPDAPNSLSARSATEHAGG